MNYSNKTYRINTKVGVENNNDINLNLNVLQKYDILEILSLKINTENVYKTHTSGYGCVVGRVLANGGVGVPNAKISIFIEVNENTSTDEVLYSLYPYRTNRSTGSNGIRYNLLPDEKVSDCHQIIGTFPNKRLVLDDKNVLEIFENYYKFTTITNESGDYMLFGIPTGNQMLHMDLDLSDIGFLSQKPVDMKYKGYNNTLFENPKQFKIDDRLDNLVQVVSQSSPIDIKPFWGEEGGEELGITRHDIDVNYKFEPTCIFMGSMVSDQNTDGFSKKCVPSRNMGRMENLTAGRGTIEMIRKKIDGSVEDYPIMGNELIDENGVWCYQIPMNLDYVITDEYGNLVPTDNPEKGIPTRTRVRFRLSKSDHDDSSNNSHLPKILIPNNPQTTNITENHYVFGTNTEEDSFRDLFWNNVYSVKSFIPRIQMGANVNSEKFSGIKGVNVNEGKNPIPYNNMRVNLTFMFVLQCAIIKALIRIVQITNAAMIILRGTLKKENCKCLTIGDGMCPDLEGWYFAPGCRDVGKEKRDRNFITNTIKHIRNNEGEDEKSVNFQNKDEDENICLTTKIDYFMQCIEINMALENRVIQFDFYNDWINGLVYLPRWYMDKREKTTFFFNAFKTKEKIYACTTEDFSNTRRYVQQCALAYKGDNFEDIKLTSRRGCNSRSDKQKCHKSSGRKSIQIFGKNKGGIIQRKTTFKGQNVYYLKPCEYVDGKKCNLYATDIILLGNINKCNLYGIPSVFDEMSSSTYQLPPALQQTNMPSDGPLYGSNGINKCSQDKEVEGVTPVEQTLSAYEKWSGKEEKIDDKTEYAVAEISGIDWGVNLGKEIKDNSDMYNPGGHFLSIGCGIAKVNIKSCTNLSRICELGVTMSQRQAIPSYEENDDGTISLTYDYLVPTGLISKDEIINNNFRTIFATLNHNHLKTKANDYGHMEYDFNPLLPNNFNGDLYGKVPYEKYRENEGNSITANPYAYIRDLEFSSGDYQLFRFGAKTTKDKIESKFLYKEGSEYYLPVYENSFYFYYGIKRGATALDIFLSEYYAECPTRGENITPGIIINVSDEVICNEKSNVLISIKNVPTPFNYKLFKGDKIIDFRNNYEITDFNITGLEIGEYTIEVENDRMGIELESKFTISEKLPETNEHNLYFNSSSMSLSNFNETPTIVFNENDMVFNNTPKDNGGIITLTLPKYDGTKKAPYILGFAVTCNDYCVCYNNKLDGGKAENKSLVYNTLYKHTNHEYIWLRNDVKIVSNEEELYNTSGNTINIMYDNDNMIVVFNGWQNDSVFNFYICYSEDRFGAINPQMLLVDSGVIGVDNRKMSYYINSEDITLSEIDANCSKEILKKVDDDDERIVKFNYDNLNALSPYEEWSIKRALYFDESYYDGGTGKIEYGAIGGTQPYKETIIGTAEYQRSDGSLEMIENVNTSIDGSIFPINLDIIEVPTIPWVDELSDDSGYIYKKPPYNITITDLNGVVPYMKIKDVFKCDKTNNTTQPNPPLDNDNSGIDLTNLIE